jgi:hypothetical protein
MSFFLKKIVFNLIKPNQFLSPFFYPLTLPGFSLRTIAGKSSKCFDLFDVLPVSAEFKYFPIHVIVG